MGYVLKESDTDEAQRLRKVGGKLQVLLGLWLMVGVKWVLHETLFVPILIYDMVEQERFRIRAVQMDNLRGSLSIRNVDKVPNARIRELCEVTKGVDERLMRLFSSGLAKLRGWRRTGSLRDYVGECAGSRSEGILRKRWIDTAKDCL